MQGAGCGQSKDGHGGGRRYHGVPGVKVAERWNPGVSDGNGDEMEMVGEPVEESGVWRDGLGMGEVIRGAVRLYWRGSLGGAEPPLRRPGGVG
jgi:hypothetical protein